MLKTLFGASEAPCSRASLRRKCNSRGEATGSSSQVSPQLMGMGNPSLSGPKPAVTGLWIILRPLITDGRRVEVEMLAVNGCFYPCPADAALTAMPLLFMSQDAAETYLGTLGGLPRHAHVHAVRVDISVPFRAWLDVVSNAQKCLREQTF